MDPENLIQKAVPQPGPDGARRPQERIADKGGDGGLGPGPDPDGKAEAMLLLGDDFGGEEPLEGFLEDIAQVGAPHLEV